MQLALEELQIYKNKKKMKMKHKNQHWYYLWKFWILKPDNKCDREIRNIWQGYNEARNPEIQKGKKQERNSIRI